MDTRFASPERSTQETILKLFEMINLNPLVKELVDKTTDIMFILDMNRQVIFTNKAFIDLLGFRDVSEVLGKRPGEALSCVHSGDVSGCGTTEFCINCGAVNAILKAQHTDTEAKEECLLSIRGGMSFELAVVARPFEFMGCRFVFFTAKDISEAKRRRALEKIFFHDILNLASGIYSIIDLYKEEPCADMPDDMISMLHRSSSEMIKEICDYRTVMMAERNELTAMPKKLRSGTLVDDVVSLYGKIAERRGIALEAADGSEDIEFRSDGSLLSRILVNMVKNALEASTKGECITVKSGMDGDRIFFSVHNPAVMRENVKTQVFKRTFTTKSTGNGLGTYSMKLLSENYLKGGVDFVSEKGKGTVFTVTLPRDI